MPAPPAGGVVVIKPTRGLTLNLREIWVYRELLYFMVWRDLKVRYKQTALGAGWAIIQPVTTIVIFSVIFGHLAKIPSDGVPYPVFSFAGLLPWLYFAAALSQSSQSIVSNKNLITKVYFPRLMVPIASVVVPLVDMLLAATVLFGLIFYYGLTPSWHVVGIFPFILMAMATAFGTGLLLAGLNVRYRDIPYVVPFVIQLWMYASPVVYPTSLVPHKWQWVLGLNPMVGVIDGFRWSLLGSAAPSFSLMLASVLIGTALTVAGLYYFKRTERSFADII
jgi:lipopolysaccharide transport system permease protein